MRFKYALERQSSLLQASRIGWLIVRKLGTEDLEGFEDTVVLRDELPKCFLVRGK
jgi:hypothetical protein